MIQAGNTQAIWGAVLASSTHCATAEGKQIELSIWVRTNDPEIPRPIPKYQMKLIEGYT